MHRCIMDVEGNKTLRLKMSFDENELDWTLVPPDRKSVLGYRFYGGF